MTPEQRAAMPDVEHPATKTMVRTIETVERLKTELRAGRVIRHFREWPRGSAEMPKRPEFVREWEQEHGPAPLSAEVYLEDQQ